MSTVFVTGCTGLLGRGVLGELLSDANVERVYALVRQPSQAALWAKDPGRLFPVHGDMLRERLDLSAITHKQLAAQVTTVVHLAATTSFSQTIDEARAVNLNGTLRLLDLASEWRSVQRWVHVSTAFVAGQRTGTILESDLPAEGGWVNGYEQSKSEAELAVRAARPDSVIVRPSTIVCDTTTGSVTQVNAVHRALRLYFRGLAAMIPGTDSTLLDAVTADYVTRGIARIARASGVDGRTFHLCAGAGAMPLDELLDVTHDVFARSPQWRRRGIARPVRADLTTYRMFESAVEATGSQRVVQAVRSLGHFVPQLAFPKVFDTAGADAVTGETAPTVASFWSAMVATLAGAASLEEVAA